MDKLTDMDLIDKFDKLTDYLSNHNTDNQNAKEEMQLVKKEMRSRGLIVA